jgi:hypothetical protein
MVRAIAAFGLLIGMLAVVWGVAWLAAPPESFGPPYGIGLIVFGAVALYSGFLVLWRGRL